MEGSVISERGCSFGAQRMHRAPLHRHLLDDGTLIDVAVCRRPNEGALIELSHRILQGIGVSAGLRFAWGNRRSRSPRCSLACRGCVS
jgi:hypothetical protein